MLRLFARELKRYLRWPWVLLALVVICIPLYFGVTQARTSVLRDELDLFAAMITNPVVLVFPVIITILTARGLASELKSRYLAYTRTRMDVRERLVVKLLAASAVAFGLLFTYCLLAFVAAFYLLPAMELTAFDPVLYGLSAETVVEDSYGRATYTSFLVLGPITYGVLYSAWVGLSAAVFAALGLAALLLVRNRILAFAVPWLVYIGQTIVFALLDLPNLGLLYSIFPFGLTPVSTLAGVAPVVILALLVACAWTTIISRYKSVDVLV